MKNINIIKATKNISLNLVSLKQLSVILGRSESSLRYHLRMGRINPTVKFGRVYSFDPEEVLKQLQRGLNPNT